MSRLTLQPVSIVNSAEAAFVIFGKKPSNGPEGQHGLKFAHVRISTVLILVSS